MTYASSRMLYGGVQHNPPSRFLSEIDTVTQAASSSSLAQGHGLIPSHRSEETSSDEPRYVPDLNEGDGVEHKVFGRGTVMEIEGDTAVVYFKGKGARKLNISFAPLEKL